MSVSPERAGHRRGTIAASAVLVLLVGCGDAGSGAGASSFAAYCDAATAIDEYDGPPTEAMMQASFDAAPDEIREQMNALRWLQEESDGDFGVMMADPAFAENLNLIEVWESEHCGPEHADPELIGPTGDGVAADGAALVVVDAVDYGFLGDLDRLEAGTVAIALTNRGDAAHEGVLLRLADGVTVDDVNEFEGDPFDEGLIVGEIGNASVHVPGSTRVLNADLEPGTYVLVCFVPGPEQTPHVFLGMQRQIIVG